MEMDPLFIAQFRNVANKEENLMDRWVLICFQVPQISNILVQKENLKLWFEAEWERNKSLNAV